MPNYNVQEYLSRTDPSISEGCMNDFSLTEADLRVVLALFQERKPRRVLEFGVNEGNTAAFLLKHCDFIEDYVGVDLMPELFPNRGIVPKEAGWRAIGDYRYRSILTNETVGDFHVKMECIGQFDALIMDANHEDWATRRDTEACWNYLKPGGLCLWHDYGVESRQHSNGRPFSLKKYLDALMSAGRQVMTPDDQPRDPWKCVSIAWEVKEG